MSALRPDTKGVTGEEFELFGPEHLELRKNVRSFVEKELQPNSQEWERNESFPKELVVAGKALHGDHGAEHLVLHDLGVLCHVGDDRRLDEEAAVADRLAGVAPRDRGGVARVPLPRRHDRHVRAARARGLPERRVLLVHGLKVASLPLVPEWWLILAALLGGVIGYRQRMHVEEYIIQYSTNSFATVREITRDALSNSYRVTGLSPGTMYHWRVRAYNASGDSPDSNTASRWPSPGSFGSPSVLSMVLAERWDALGYPYPAAVARYREADARLRARAYAYEHGEDPPEVRDWTWPS